MVVAVTAIMMVNMAIMAMLMTMMRAMMTMMKKSTFGIHVLLLLLIHRCCRCKICSASTWQGS